jgi:hypothetical protein
MLATVVLNSSAIWRWIAFVEGDLTEEATVKESLTVRSDSGHQVRRRVQDCRRVRSTSTG